MVYEERENEKDPIPEEYQSSLSLPVPISRLRSTGILLRSRCEIFTEEQRMFTMSLLFQKGLE